MPSFDFNKLNFFARKPFDERSPHFDSLKDMRSESTGHHVSFKHAWNGIVIAFMTQPNLRIHLAFFVLINIASYVFRVTLTEYIVLLLISGAVITAEMINTTIEALGDEIAQGRYRQLIGVAKDVAAGAVLVAAFFAVVIGAIIFVPKIIALIQI